MAKRRRKKHPLREYTFETVFPEPFVREWKKRKEELEEKIMSEEPPELRPSDEEVEADMIATKTIRKNHLEVEKE